MLKYILIITSSFDKTVDFFFKTYQYRYPLLRINLDKLDSYKISITNNSVFFEYNSQLIDLYENIKSIYFRKIFLPDLVEYEEKYKNYMQKEIYSFIVGLADSFNGIVLSKPSLLRQVENKIYQLHVAESLNFLLPESIISNDKEYVNKNIVINEWIAKPLSIGKITQDKTVLTNVVTQVVNDIELSPTYFQKKIIGDYELRVTYINGFFYCVKINSNKIDWRDDLTVKYSLIETPEIIKQQCTKFVKKMNLGFGVFDYIVKKNQYFFLECNPNGQWLWLETKLNLDISKRILDYLDA